MILDYSRALATPVAPAHPAEAYVGRYGDRTVGVTEGKLTTWRDRRPVTQLVAVGPDSFALESDPAVRFLFTFDADGRADALRVVQSDGSTSVIHRSADGEQTNP